MLNDFFRNRFFMVKDCAIPECHFRKANEAHCDGCTYEVQNDLWQRYYKTTDASVAQIILDQIANLKSAQVLHDTWCTVKHCPHKASMDVLCYACTKKQLNSSYDALACATATEDRAVLLDRIAKMWAEQETLDGN